MKHKRILGYSAIGLTLIAVGVAFIKPVSANSILFRARAANATSATITFDKNNSSRSDTTNTTTAFTSSGAMLICKSFSNDSTQSNGYVGAVKYGSYIKFYESDGVTEFTFEDVDSITINKDSNNFGFRIHYVYAGGTSGTTSTFSTKTDATRTISFTGAGYGDVSNLWLECMTNDSSVAKINSVVLTYNCQTKTQTGLSITTEPYKKTYEEGESFDPSGMVVKATYSNETSVATKSYTISPSGALSHEDTYVTISFGGFSVNQLITVTALPVLTGIYVDTAPSKTSYTAGESFSTTGMVIKGTYDDGNDRTITDYTYSPNGALTTSDTTITISYGGFATTQAITVESASEGLSGLYSNNASFNFTSSNAGTYTYGSFVLYFSYSISNSAITFTYVSGNNNDFGNYKLFNGTATTNTTGSVVSLTQIRVSVYGPFGASSKLFTKSS